MTLAPLSRTIIIYEGGINAQPTEAITIPVDGSPPPPPPPPPPTLGNPTIEHDGTPQAGELLTGVDGAVTNLGGNTLTRRWLLGGTVLSTSATYTPGATGTFTFQNRLIAPGGSVLLTTSASVTVAAAGGGDPEPSYIGPDLKYQADPLAFPPAPANLVTKSYHPVGAKLRVRAVAVAAGTVAQAHEALLAGTGLLIDDASFTLTGNHASNLAGLHAVLAGIASGATVFWVRVEESPSVFSAWSNVLLHGTNEVPTVSPSGSTNVVSTKKLAQTWTLSAPGYVEIVGDDRARFDLGGVQGGRSYPETWEGDGVKDYGAPDDLDRNRTYDHVLRVTGLQGATADYPRPYVLTDYDVTADPITLSVVAGDETAAPLNSNTTYESNVISGLASDYEGQITLTGQWTRARIHDGASWGAWFTSAGLSGKLLANGRKYQVDVTNSGSYSTSRAFTSGLNSVTVTKTSTTLADPTGIVPTFHPYTVVNNSFSAAPAVHTVILKQGVNVLHVETDYGAVDSVAIGDGIGAATLRGSIGTTQLWEVVAGADITTTAALTPAASPGNLRRTFVSVANLANAKPGPLSGPALSAGYKGDGPMPMDGPATVATGNIALVAWMVQGGFSWTVGTAGASYPAPETEDPVFGYLTATGTPTLNHTTGGVARGIALIWEKN